jgi:hypothetical protein
LLLPVAARGVVELTALFGGGWIMTDVAAGPRLDLGRESSLGLAIVLVAASLSLWSFLLLLLGVKLRAIDVLALPWAVAVVFVARGARSYATARRG